jgi:hypothetical protein
VQSGRRGYLPTQPAGRQAALLLSAGQSVHQRLLSKRRGDTCTRAAASVHGRSNWYATQQLQLPVGNQLQRLVGPAHTWPPRVRDGHYLIT